MNASMKNLIGIFRHNRVDKPLPPAVFRDIGSGTDFETHPSAWGGFITPVDRFYVRNHGHTPSIDVRSWRLKIYGSGVSKALQLSYDDLQSLPQTNLTRTLECAGNGRAFFKHLYGKEAEGGQWGLGAMGCAEWAGVRLRHLLQHAGIKDDARDVMPAGLDEKAISRPMTVEKAMRDDTLLALTMNGHPLLPDHGYPARVIVSGWAGAASIKWVGSIEVSQDHLYSHHNTKEYVLVGPDHPKQPPADGPPLTEMPVISALDLEWPAKLTTRDRRLHGRSFAGESEVREVVFSVDGAGWTPVQLVGPKIEGCWRLWSLEWAPTPGKHEIRVRATDERGRTQPDHVPWNDHGYIFNAVVPHPIIVS